MESEPMLTPREKLCSICHGVNNYYNSTTWLTCFGAGDVEEEGTWTMVSNIVQQLLYIYITIMHDLPALQAGDAEEEGTRTMVSHIVLQLLC